MNLDRLTIGTRLGAGFGIVLLLLGAIAGMGAWQLSRVFAGADRIAEHWLPSVEVLGSIQANANAVRRLSLRLTVVTDPASRSDQITRRAAAIATLNRNFQTYEPMIGTPRQRELYENVRRDWSAYLGFDDKVVAASQNGESGMVEARGLANGDASRLFTDALKNIDAGIALNHEGAMDEIATARERYRSGLLLAGVLGAVSLLAGVAIALWITRSITAPIAQAIVLAETVASGELNVRIEVHGRDEAARLQAAMKRMTESLGEIVGRVTASADGIARGSAEIAAGNIDLSQRTEEQAAALEQTASSMEQMTATVKQNADNARQGNALARNASDVASRGGEVVAQVVDTMQAITESSRQVGSIIAMIEGIAFQTNILALNAAVEAARAGEQGRGFAVVAGEVRTLAQRSAAAAKDIKALIDTSVGRVAQGTALVAQAGDTIREIVVAVTRVTDLMGEITSASEEQQKGIEQINQAVSQMDQVTQQNAALVEEAAAAAQSLESQGGELRDAVAFFRSGATERVPAPPAVSTARERAAMSRAAAPARHRGIAASPSRPLAAASSSEGDGWATF